MTLKTKSIILLFAVLLTGSLSAQEGNSFKLTFKDADMKQSRTIELPDSLSKYTYNKDYSNNYSLFNEIEKNEYVPAHYLGYQFVHRKEVKDGKMLNPPRLRDALSHFGFSFEFLDKMETVEVKERFVSIPLYKLPSDKTTYDPEEVWDLKHSYLLLIDLEKQTFQLFD